MKSENFKSRHSTETIMAALAELRRGVDVEIVKEKYAIADWTLADLRRAYLWLSQENARVIRELKEQLSTLLVEVDGLSHPFLEAHDCGTTRPRRRGFDRTRDGGLPDAARKPANRRRH